MVLFAFSIKNTYALDNIQVSVGDTRQILLGAVITTGKLQSGTTWSSSNSNVAEIIDSQSGNCSVRGIQAGTATISASYKYDVGGSIISSFWSCYVTVISSGNEDDEEETSTKAYALIPSQSNFELDLAAESGSRCGTLRFGFKDESGHGFNKVPVYAYKEDHQYIKYNYADSDCRYNGQSYDVFESLSVCPVKIGTENNTFYYAYMEMGKWYIDRTVSPVTVKFKVVCSHNFDDGIIIQELSETTSEITEYTCSICGEKYIEERYPEFGIPDMYLPEDIEYIEENAFYGTSAHIVYIPDGCLAIENNAFSNNKSLTHIRVPDGCTVAENAFDENNNYFMYGNTGSYAEEFCESQSNCTFIPEITD